MRRTKQIGVGWLFVGGLLLLLLCSCVSQPMDATREPIYFRVVAASSCDSIAQRLIAVYEEQPPQATIDLTVFNNAIASDRLRSGEADVALLSWVGEEENALWTAPFAEHEIAVVAHSDFPLQEVGLAVLHEVFRGQLQEWEGVALTPVSREEGAGTRAVFERMALGGGSVTLNAVVAASDEAVLEAVASREGGIGYVSTCSLSDERLAGMRVVPVEGVLPKDEGYLLQAPLYLATVGEPAGNVRDFAQWVVSPAGRSVVE